MERFAPVVTQFVWISIDSQSSNSAAGELDKCTEAGKRWEQERRDPSTDAEKSSYDVIR